MHKKQRTISLRQAVHAADPAEVEALVAETGFFSKDETLIARELVETYAAQGEASGYRFVFAESAGRMVGYACYGPIPGTEQRYDLYWIAVTPGMQGTGIGQRLLRESERLVAQEAGRRIYIETSSQPLYEHTRRFYTAAGYSLEARLRDFYRDGDDKLIYCRALPA